jgi:hypothetical protein
VQEGRQIVAPASNPSHLRRKALHLLVLGLPGPCLEPLSFPLGQSVPSLLRQLELECLLVLQSFLPEPRLEQLSFLLGLLLLALELIEQSLALL